MNSTPRIYLKNILYLLLMFLPLQLQAQTLIDVYGTKPAIAQKIIQQHGKQITQLDNYLSSLLKIPENLDPTKIESLYKKYEELKEKIKKQYHLLYININTVHYPAPQNPCTTIEVIEATAPERLKLVSSPDTAISPHKDIIQNMIDYEALAMNLFLNNKLPAKAVCVLNHCAMGFNHPQLQPYFNLFNKSIKTEKNFIVHTLQTDPDTNRRAAAAFLIGHFKNAEEIITLLTPHVLDNNSGVRNNVIRVIASTMHHAQIHHINPQPFIKLLSSPYNSDRNKSLYVLLTSAENKITRQALISKADQPLLDLLALKQPNNHDPAYQILKKISGQDFGEYNLSAWRQWFKTANAHNA